MKASTNLIKIFSVIFLSLVVFSSAGFTAEETEQKEKEKQESKSHLKTDCGHRNQDRRKY